MGKLRGFLRNIPVTHKNIFSLQPLQAANEAVAPRTSYLSRFTVDLYTRCQRFSEIMTARTRAAGAIVASTVAFFLLLAGICIVVYTWLACNLFKRKYAFLLSKAFTCPRGYSKKRICSLVCACVHSRADGRTAQEHSCDAAAR